jgi:hypothetical protein
MEENMERWCDAHKMCVNYIIILSRKRHVYIASNCEHFLNARNTNESALIIGKNHLCAEHAIEAGFNEAEIWVKEGAGKPAVPLSEYRRVNVLDPNMFN